MKRLLIIVALVVVIYFGVTTVVNGFVNDTIKLNVTSYKGIQDKSDSLTMAVNAYNQKNETEYETAVLDLNGNVKKYKNSKAIYEELIEDLTAQGQLNQVIEEQIIYSPKKQYDVDFLQTRIGTYTNKSGLVLTLSLRDSEYIDPASSVQDFTVCNLEFIVTGEYIDIANFLSDIENDDELAFEIRDYDMEKGIANFMVYNVRITNESLLQFKSTEGEQGSGAMTNPSDGTTMNSNTTDTTNTTAPGGTTNTTSTSGNVTTQAPTTNSTTTTTPVGNTAQ